jgi:hypothetical protein
MQQINVNLHRFGANLRSSFTECWDLPTFWLEVARQIGVAKLAHPVGSRVAGLGCL